MLTVLSALPVAVRGPDYVLDDWYLLADARFDGWWLSLSRELFLARPGSGVVYAVVFGLVGRHALVAYALQVALVGVAAVLIRSVLRRFVPTSLATATAAMWAVVPNHQSLLHWATGSAITVALILVLAGIVLLADGRHGLAAVLLGASILCYEATAPVAGAALVAVPWLQGRPWRRPLLVGAAGIVPAAAWIVAFIPSVKQGIHRTADLGLLLPAHAGWGVFPDGPVATVLGLLATVALTLLIVDAVWSRSWSTEVRLALAGIAVILLGTLPFVRYFYAPLGAGDRVNVVAGVGTAMLWTGLLASAGARLPRLAFRPLATAVVVAMAAAAWQGSMAWAAAADDAARVLGDLPPLPPGTSIVVDRPPLHRNVAAFLDRSNIESAVQLEADTRDVAAQLRVRRAGPGR